MVAIIIVLLCSTLATPAGAQSADVDAALTAVYQLEAAVGGSLQR